MKIKIREINDNRPKSKLACVKQLKEWARLDLRGAKEITDGCMNGGFVEVEVFVNRGDIEFMKNKFSSWGYEISGGRDEAIENLIGDGYKYIVEFLHREVTYRIEEGSYEMSDGKYILHIDIGNKLDDNGERQCNGRKVIIPIDVVVVEENLL